MLSRKTIYHTWTGLRVIFFVLKPLTKVKCFFRKEGQLDENWCYTFVQDDLRLDSESADIYIKDSWHYECSDCTVEYCVCMYLLFVTSIASCGKNWRCACV